jgi:predicted nucleotidyltransferase
MVAIENRLADMLGARVDLSPASGLKEPVAAKAAHEAVLAF